MDESVVVELLLNKNDFDFPDVAVVVTDVENLKRNLLLFTQIKDLEIPTVLVINMSDQMKIKGIKINLEKLEEKLDTKVVLVSTRINSGINELKQTLVDYRSISTAPLINTISIDIEYFESLKDAFPNQTLYKLWLIITQDVNFTPLKRQKVPDSSKFKAQPKSYLKKLQQRETIKRYQTINKILKETYQVNRDEATDLRFKLDNLLIHKFWGYVIFFLILLSIFQAIFDWSSVPMNFIDNGFAQLSKWVKIKMPEGILTSLVSEGIISGLGGIVTVSYTHLRAHET